MKQYYAFHKPYGVLSQFTKEVESHVTLADYVQLDSDIYPVGRLDKDSEGLLLLTNDNILKTRILSPTTKLKKEYWVQVDGAITPEAITSLQEGVDIKINKKIHRTLPADVTPLRTPSLEERDPPVRFRANIPTSWISITIIEGKNRQIRRMCAAVGYPVLRLVRTTVGRLSLGDLSRGEVKQLSPEEVRLLS